MYANRPNDLINIQWTKDLVPQTIQQTDLKNNNKKQQSNSIQQNSNSTYQKLSHHLILY